MRGGVGSGVGSLSCMLVCAYEKTGSIDGPSPPFWLGDNQTTGARGEATELKDQRDEEEDGGAIPEPGAHPQLQHGRTISLAKKLPPGAEKEAEPEERPTGMRRGKSFSVSVTAQVRPCMRVYRCRRGGGLCGCTYVPNGGPDADPTPPDVPPHVTNRSWAWSTRRTGSSSS